MNRLSNFTGHARHGFEKMTPSMGFGMRPHPSQQDNPMLLPSKRAMPGSAMSPNPAVPGHMVNLSFNVPFNSNLPGPEKEDVLWSNTGAFQRWVHQEDGAEDSPNHALPVHVRNVEDLRVLCKRLSDSSDGRVYATVTSAKPKPVPGMQRMQSPESDTTQRVAGIDEDEEDEEDDPTPAPPSRTPTFERGAPPPVPKGEKLSPDGSLREP